MQTLAALLKREIEAKLANRIPAALSPVRQQAARLHPTGQANIDRLLGGGLPLGSGRCTVALSLLAEASGEGACAYIDVSDVLSPHSAAAAGVELSNLLWVRFAAVSLRQGPAILPLPKTTPADETLHRPVHGGCGSSHPRRETKGLAPALEQMLFYKEERRRRKSEGTPGHPNQPLGLHTASKEQVDWERFNLRKVDETDPLRVMDQQAAKVARQQAAASSPRMGEHTTVIPSR